MSISIQNASSLSVTKTRIKYWTQAVLTQQQKEFFDITIRFVDANQITLLNTRYRDKNAPTNVLSFPADLPDEIDIQLLGDVVVCQEVIQQEAIMQQKPFEAHLAHIIIHGILHLCGFDHQSVAQANVMEALEIKLLGEFGFANPYL